MIRKNIFILLILPIFIISIFRGYFINHKVLFPANLLVSYYQPWVSYPWEGYPSGPPNKPIGFDNLRIFYPFRHLTTQSLLNFELPLWNPYDFSGNIHLAGYQTAVFHPLSFMFLILPQIDAWSIIIILSPIFTFIFTYLFVKELKLSKEASIFGALGFAFSGFMMVLWEESFMASYSALFLPIVLCAIVKICRKLTRYNFLTLVLGLAFSLLSGWFQISLYLYVFSYFFSLYLLLTSFRKKQEWKKPFIAINSAYIISIFISAVFLIPNIESYFYSARGSTDAKFIFDIYLQPFWHLATFLAPDFFGNPGAYNYFGKGFYYEKVLFLALPVLFFALTALFSKTRDFTERYFKWGFLITLSLGFSLPTSWLLLYYLKLPFFSVILPSRIFYLSTFSLVILAAFGFENYLKTKNIERRIFISLFLLFAGCLVLWGFVMYFKFFHPLNEFSLISFRNLFIPTLILVLFLVSLLMLKKYKKIFYLFTLFLIFISTIYFTDKYLYLSDRKFVYPEAPVINKLKELSGNNRFWSYDKAYIERNFSTYFNLYSPEGYDSIYIQRYGELIFASQNNGIFTKQIPRTDATINGMERLNEILSNSYKERIINLLGIKHIVGPNKEESIKYSSLPIVWKDNKFVIYENTNVFPRTYITSGYEVEKDNRRILAKVFNKDTDLRKVTVLEDDPKIKFSNSDNNIVKITKYTSNKVEIKGKGEKGGILFLSDNYYPGWKVYIDGKISRVYRANYSFRAVVFPSGQHTVTFSYESLTLKLGFAVTFIGGLILIVVFLKIPSLSSSKDKQ